MGGGRDQANRISHSSTPPPLRTHSRICGMTDPIELPKTDSAERSVSPTSLDPQAIAAVLRVGGVALLERLVDVAEGNLRNRFSELEEALAATPSDRAAAERAAHSAKSSAAYLGAEALRRHAEEMECDARDDRLAKLPAKLDEARRLLELVLPALREEVKARRLR